jgi:hypothetical protein
MPVGSNITIQIGNNDSQIRLGKLRISITDNMISFFNVDTNKYTRITLDQGGTS